MKSFCSNNNPFPLALADGNLQLNLVTQQAFLNGQMLLMTAKEFELLKLFLENPNRILHKNYISVSIWGTIMGNDFSILSAYISKLREKIEINPKKPTRIVTVWGMGYRYEGAR